MADAQTDAPAADSGAATSTTVAALRMTPPANHAAVRLTGVVIVGWVTSSKYGHIWVQDAGGGPYSGVQLFCNYGGSHPDCPMMRSDVEALVRGQVVDVTGDYAPFTPRMPAGAPTLVEIGQPMITPTGSTMAPVAVTVTPADVAKDALSADMYHSVYVTMMGSFSVSSVTASEFLNTSYACTPDAMGGMSAPAPQYFGFEATDGSSTLAIALNMYKSEHYCLDACFDAMCVSATTPGHMRVSVGDAFTSITGIVEPGATATETYLSISPVVDGDLGH